MANGEIEKMYDTLTHVYLGGKTNALPNTTPCHCTEFNIDRTILVAQETIKLLSEMSSVIPTTAILTKHCPIIYQQSLERLYHESVTSFSKGKTETTDVTTSVNPSILESSSVKQEESECSSSIR
ncbi:hypothetical protein CHS0354_026696 [Potamilus streckersoni]|uniref:Uncharacterized protein n=1 Tax=Potamilus streckersoni TaxID=2493646 RepID=A0AAE0VS36_9BIVA|nr:hypothetical protein CHS0354_026696 [Potamilus streckersoni]